MNTMLERVEVFQRHQRQFVSDASHELRSPIAIVRQLTEVAIAHPERNDDQLIGDIHAETVRMQAVVEDLLLLARGRSTALADSGRAVDLDDLALAELQRLRASTSLTVDGTGVGPARTVGSELRLARAVSTTPSTMPTSRLRSAPAPKGGRPPSLSMTTAPASPKPTANGCSTAS
jgi:signal transduction histidine kinase